MATSGSREKLLVLVHRSLEAYDVKGFLSITFFPLSRTLWMSMPLYWISFFPVSFTGFALMAVSILSLSHTLGHGRHFSTCVPHFSI